jgi:hypothetical protein
MQQRKEDAMTTGLVDNFRNESFRKDMLETEVGPSNGHCDTTHFSHIGELSSHV